MKIHSQVSIRRTAGLTTVICNCGWVGTAATRAKAERRWQRHADRYSEQYLARYGAPV